MPAAYHRVALLFVDGVGLGEDAPTNPLATEPTPGLQRLVGGRLLRGCEGTSPGRVVAALDACLGISGLPQSATGQTALFSGVNAAAALGRHVPALPGPRLKAILDAHGLFAEVTRRGLHFTFANAFTDGYLDRIRAGASRSSATTHCVLAAGVAMRTEPDLEAGRAVSWDVTRDLYYRRIGHPGPPIEPQLAGRHLADLTKSHDLTLYETFLTDLAGHRRWGIGAAEAVRRVDGLVEGFLEADDETLTLVMVSDHGNLEEDEHRSHTRNPVPFVAAGPRAGRLVGLTSITEVAPRLLSMLSS